MLKIGIIGVGYLGNFHLNNLLTHDQIKVTGFYDIDDDRSQFIAQKYYAKNFDNRQELLDASDALLVVTPTNTHYEITKDALENGLHVFCEKPVTETIEQAEDLMAIAKNNNLILQVGHIERFNPAFKILEDYQLAPKFIECHRISQFNERGINSAVIPELMIHDLDIILKLVDSKITNIEASGTPVLTDNIDIANVRIDFANGCVANITASRVSDKKVRKFRIFQQNAYINIDFLNKKTDIFSLDKKSEEYHELAGFQIADKEKKTIYFKQMEAPDSNAMLDEQKDFIQAITKQQDPMVTGEDGLAALKLALQIEQTINQKLAELDV
ncbi:MAG: Gfo/Idh/MocA family protein [Fidelibacterota bacterium]